MTATYAEADQGGFGVAAPDVHWAGAYITTKRLDSLDMTDPFSSAPLSLMVKRFAPEWGSRLMAVFKPFATDLYWAITILWWFSATLFFAMEYTASNENLVFAKIDLMKSSASAFTKRRQGGLQRGLSFRGKSPGKSHGKKKKGLMRPPRKASVGQVRLRKQLEAARSSWAVFFGCYLDQLYLGFLTLTGVKTFSPTISEGKQLSLLWNVVVVIIRTSFVASSAVYLVQSASIEQPSTFPEHLHPDLKVCVLGGSAYAGFLSNHRK
jgi:hypothetical protein